MTPSFPSHFTFLHGAKCKTPSGPDPNYHAFAPAWKPGPGYLPTLAYSFPFLSLQHAGNPHSLLLKVLGSASLKGKEAHPHLSGLAPHWVARSGCEPSLTFPVRWSGPEGLLSMRARAAPPPLSSLSVSGEDLKNGRSCIRAEVLPSSSSPPWHWHPASATPPPTTLGPVHLF